jgi:hypothetical protein
MNHTDTSHRKPNYNDNVLFDFVHGNVVHGKAVGQGKEQKARMGWRDRTRDCSICMANPVRMRG